MILFHPYSNIMLCIHYILLWLYKMSLRNTCHLFLKPIFNIPWFQKYRCIFDIILYIWANQILCFISHYKKFVFKLFCSWKSVCLSRYNYLNLLYIYKDWLECVPNSCNARILPEPFDWLGSNFVYLFFGSQQNKEVSKAVSEAA